MWHISPEGRLVRVGRIGVEEEGASFFRYEEVSSLRVPLDPLNLPLEERLYRSRFLGPPLLVFDDTLPDAWGLAILSKRHRQDFLRNRHLALGLQDTSMVGGILFSEGPAPPPPPTWIPWKALKECFAEAQRFEIRKADLIFRYLGVSGTSAGGARPKVTVVDEAGWPWLVKLPSVNDPSPHTVAQVEAAGLSLAKDMGIPVPEFRVLRLGGASLLAVKRFDISRLVPPYHGRRVLLSFSTLLGGMHMVEEGYEKAGALLRRVSTAPEEDTLSFFRLALVNVFIVNTDDHLKNFALLWDGRELRLSPAFDLVGNLWGMSQHSMFLNGKADGFVLQDLISLGRSLGLAPAKAKAEIAKARTLCSIYLENLKGIPGTGTLVSAVKQRLEGLVS